MYLEKCMSIFETSTRDGRCGL